MGRTEISDPQGTPMNPEQLEQYRRHILLPQVGEKGQEQLLQAKVLLVGAGGLGSPAAIYLAAAGVGTLGIVDSDQVDLSNLQRQILHSHEVIGKPKVESARETLRRISPGISFAPYAQLFDSQNAMQILKDYDLVLDCADNFSTKYLLNDACYFAAKPLAYGTIFQFEGHATLFHRGHGPCYRCLFPVPPPPAFVPNRNEVGVLGVLPGIIGIIQATEAIKWILGIGTSLLGRLLLYDALEMSFREVKFDRNPDCPLCGDRPTILSLSHDPPA